MTQDSLLGTSFEGDVATAEELEELYQRIGKDLNSGKKTNVDVELVKKLIRSANTAHLDRYVGLGLNLYSISYQDRAKFDSALYFQREAQRYLKKAGDSVGYYKAKGNMGLTYAIKGELAKALRSLREVEKWRTEHYSSAEYEGELDLGNVYNNIFAIHFMIEDWENAEKYAKLSLELTPRENVNMHVAGLVNLGQTRCEAGKYDEAVEPLNQALDIIYEGNQDLNPMLKASLMTQMATLYAHRGETRLAQEYIDRAREILDPVELSSNKMALMKDVLEYYRTYGMDEEAVEYSIKLHDLDVIQNIPFINQEVSKTLFDHYRSKGEYKKAIDHLDDYLLATEALSKEELEKQVIRETMRLEHRNEQLSDSLRTVKRLAEQKVESERQLQEQNRLRNYALMGGGVIAILALGLFLRVRQTRKNNRLIRQAQERSDQLLLNILPGDIADELHQEGKVAPRYLESVTVLFTDFAGFTEMSDALGARELIDRLDKLFSAFDEITERHGVEKIKTIGDSYLAAGGIPTPSHDAAKRTVMAALEMQELLSNWKEDRSDDQKPFQMRIGIHSGPVIAGVVGTKKFQFDIWGNTVNVASRMESAGEVGRVNISHQTYTLLKDDPDLMFEERGSVEVKGKGMMEMWFVQRRVATG